MDGGWCTVPIDNLGEYMEKLATDGAIKKLAPVHTIQSEIKLINPNFNSWRFTALKSHIIRRHL
jgi:hypothetical protein